MFLLTSVVLYAILLHVVHALPLVKRIVVDPPITSPSASTVWTPGSIQLVTWDPSIVPSTGNFPGTILLGYVTPGSENLDINHPLASGFSLRDGSVQVTCPTVSPRNNYIVVLMGDSGNASPQFTISGPDAASGSASSASSNNQPTPTPSSTDPVAATPQQAAATSTTSDSASASSSPTDPAPSSDSSAPSYTPAVTSSSSVTTPPAPVSAASSPSSSSSSSASTSSAGSNSPVGGLKANNAIARTWNAGTVVTCAVVTIFTMFSL